MSLPKKVKIGWKEYKILEQAPDEALIDGGTICYGQVFYDRQEIYINKNYRKKHKKATLLHEVIHAIDEQYSIDLKEEQVVSLTHGLMSVLKDNPEILSGGDPISRQRRASTSYFYTQIRDRP